MGFRRSTDSDGFLHVVAAVIDDGSGRIVIARRPEHLHQGGLWEFPGGKVEQGETVRDALARELKEELGIAVEAARPLIRVRHAYPDRRVLLDVWRVTRFTGKPQGREGQPLRSVAPDELPGYPFPTANEPIIAAARLPPLYLITPVPGPESEWARFLDRLAERVALGIGLIQLRAHSLDTQAFSRLAREVIAVGEKGVARIIVNAEPDLAADLGADGVHLTEKRLRNMRARPLPKEKWVIASCHTADDLEHAAFIGADAAVLSPVRETASHADAVPLGWAGFASMVESSPLPVYALGGMGLHDRDTAWLNGAQGIAAIRGLWTAPAESIRRCLNE